MDSIIDLQSLDYKDDVILLGVHNRDSYTEMAEATMLRSTSTIFGRLAKLEKAGLITPPKAMKRGSAPRTRRLTDAGEQYLRKRGLLGRPGNPCT
jgi:SOS-response transcriptional repressor LexA